MDASAIADRLGAKRNGSGWVARCPAHDDRNPSLSISEGDDGRTLLCCHAGCPTDAVLAAANLRASDLFTEDRPIEQRQRRRNIAAYDYTDAEGNVLYQVVRTDPKGFWQRRPDGNGGWVNGRGNVNRTLYRLPEVLAAIAANHRVFIVEGEKDADAISREWELCAATCGPEGAGNWKHVAEVAREVLAGADVTVIADKDAAGYKHALEVVESLEGVAEEVELLEAAIGKDAAEHIGAGKDYADLVPAELPADAGSDDGPPTEDDYLDAERLEGWQPVDIAAYLDGDRPPDPTPELLAPRNLTGQPVAAGLFYPGCINSAHGDSGAGKSLLLAKAAQEAMASGRTVVWIDLEATLAETVARLLALGASEDTLRQHLVYVAPTNTVAAAVEHLLELVTRHEAALVVLDSLGEAFALDGVNEDADAEVGPWMRRVLRPVAAAGPALCLVDHSTKAKDNPLFPSGSKRKRAAWTGAGYLVTAPKPFAVGRSGLLKVTVAKDRHGTRARGEEAIRVEVEPQSNGELWMTPLLPPERDTATEDTPGGAFDAQVIAAVGDYLERDPSRHASRNELEERALAGIRAGKDRKRASLDWAVREGHLSEETGPRNARLHGWVRDLNGAPK